MHDTIYRIRLLFKECANIEFDKLGSENSQCFRQYIKDKNIWNSKVYQSERCQKYTWPSSEWPKLDLKADLFVWEVVVNLEFIAKSKEFEFGSNEFFAAHRVSCQPRLQHQVECDSNCLGNPTCSLLAKEFWRNQHGFLNHRLVQSMNRSTRATNVKWFRVPTTIFNFNPQQRAHPVGPIGYDISERNSRWNGVCTT